MFRVWDEAVPVGAGSGQEIPQWAAGPGPALALGRDASAGRTEKSGRAKAKARAVGEPRGRRGGKGRSNNREELILNVQTHPKGLVKA